LKPSAGREIVHLPKDFYLNGALPFFPNSVEIFSNLKNLIPP
jgi:hypothetical protein